MTTPMLRKVPMMAAVLAAMVVAACGGDSSPSANPAAPTGLTYAVSSAVYTVGTAITGNTPGSSGGAVVSYSVSPALPVGLSMNTTTGVISGTPTTVAAAATYTVTATNSAGQATVGVSITVNAAVAAPTGLTYAVNPAVYTVGAAIPANTPSSSGGAVVSYGVAPALPAGLTLNTATGVITGTPTAAAATGTYTVTASNSAGQATAGVSITVNPAPTLQYYSGSASVGDFLQITVNGTAKTLSYANLSNGTSGTNVTYTVNGDGTYSFSPDPYLMMAYEIPGYAVVMLISNAGMNKTAVALVTAMSKTSVSIPSFFGRRFNYFKMKQSGGGIQVGSLSVNGSGQATGSIYLPADALYDEPANTAPRPPGVTAFELIAAALPSDPTPVDYLPVPGGAGTAYLYGTTNGLWILDEPDGTTLGLPGGTDAGFQASFAGTYRWLWFKKVVTGYTGTGIELGVVSTGKSNLTLDATGGLQQIDGTGATVWQAPMQPVSATSWLYGNGSDGKLSNPANGVFAARKLNQTGDTRTDAFLILFPGQLNMLVFAKFVTAYPVVDATKFTYVYGIAFPVPASN